MQQKNSNNANWINNAKWIISCKIVQALLQFVIGMISARYLGPSNYGLINYAASVTAFFVPLMELGLRHLLVQSYVCDPEKEGKVLGTALVMNLLSAAACVAGVTAFAAVANRGETVTVIVCALYSTSMIFQAVEMTQYWFQAKLLSKYSSLAVLFAYVVVSAYKIWLLASGKSVYWFALSHTVEYGFGGLMLLIAYRKNGRQKIGFSFALARELFAKSRHYIVASLMVVVYGKVGSILLTLIYGEAENGYFATATTCTCIFSFAFAAIMDTARPVILESRRENPHRYGINVSRLYALTIWVSLAQSVVFTVFAGWIVRFLYGEAYLPAVPVLQILSWQIAFSYMGVVRNIWILAEEKHNQLWKINLSGAVASIILNAVMIPLWGACGAALASVLTQIFTNVIVGFLLRPIRENNRLLVRGLDPRLLLDMLQILKKQLRIDEK